MKWQIEKVESLEALQIEQKLVEKMAEVSGIVRNRRYEQLFVATEQQKVIGIGVCWLNEFHPTAVYFRIFIHDQVHNKNGVADALFGHIKKGTIQQDKWIWSGWESNQYRCEFLDRNGFQLMRKTCMPVLKVADIEKYLAPLELPDNCLSLHEVLNNLRLKESFLNLLKETYTATHQINPVSTYSLDDWEEILLEDSPDTEYSLVCLHPSEPHRIDGYIMLHSINHQKYEVGWLGERDGAEPDLLQRLFKRQLESLKETGVEELELEVDTTDWHAMKLFDFLNFEEYDAWETYLLIG